MILRNKIRMVIYDGTNAVRVIQLFDSVRGMGDRHVMSVTRHIASDHFQITVGHTSYNLVRGSVVYVRNNKIHGFHLFYGDS